MCRNCRIQLPEIDCRPRVARYEPSLASPAKKIGLSESTIGVLFGLGALVVLATQMPTLRWVRGRRRMRCLALMNVAFFIGFVATSFSVGVSVQVAIALIVLGQTFGGIGEGFLGAIR